MKRHWNNDKTNELVSALRSFKTDADLKSFLRDLLTEDEIVEFGKRWEAARMLAAGIPYSEISKAVGLSSRTVARVAQWLNKGEGGYKLALKYQKK
jgi:TrpR-related protein YerC/YecD